MFQRRKSFRLSKAHSDSSENTSSSSLRIDKFSSSSDTATSGEERLPALGAKAKKWFSAITAKNSRRFMQELIDRWFAIFESDQQLAMCKLLEYLLYFVGLKVEITEEQLQTPNVHNELDKLIKYTRNDLRSYPLKIAKEETRLLILFLDTLIRQTNEQLLNSDAFTINLWTWLEEMCTSFYLDVRHTGAFICFKIAFFFNRLHCDKKQSISLLQKNLEKTNIALDNLDENSGLQSITQQLERLKEFNDKLFTMCAQIETRWQKLVVDPEPVIRQLCISEYSHWISTYPVTFCRRRFLEKIVLLLNDQFSNTRLKCIECIQKFLPHVQQNDQTKALLNEITNKLAYLATLDDAKVATSALNALYFIVQNDLTLFEKEDILNLFNGVFSVHNQVAHASANFVMLFLKINAESRMTEQEFYTSGGKKIHHDAQLIVELIHFYLEMSVPKRFKKKALCLTMCLIDRHPIWSAWQIMCDLLSEHVISLSLDHNGEVALADLLLHFIKIQVKNVKDVTGSRKQNLRPAEQARKQQQANEITNKVTPLMANLIQQYKADKEVSSILVNIPRYFAFQSLSQQGENIESLIIALNDVIYIHSDETLLHNCFKTYSHLINEKNPHAKNVLFFLEELLDKLRVEFMQKWSSKESVDQLEIVAIKLLIANNHLNLSNHQVWENVFQCLLTSPYILDFTHLFLQNLIIGCLNHLLWMREQHAREWQPGELDSFQQRLIMFFAFLNEGLSQFDLPLIRLSTFFCTCDMLVYFGKHLQRESSEIKTLAFEPNEQFIKNLVSSINDLVLQFEKNEKDKNSLKELFYSFTKLIIYGLIEAKYSTEILKHFELVKNLQLHQLLYKIYERLCEEEWGEIIENVTRFLFLQDDFQKAKEFSQNALDHLYTKAKKGKRSRGEQQIQIMRLLMKGIFSLSSLIKNQDPIEQEHLFNYLNILKMFIGKLHLNQRQILSQFMERENQNLIELSKTFENGPKIIELFLVKDF